MPFVSLALAILASLALIAPANAEYPDKPIRIMALYAPGGNIDVTARIIADKLKDVLGVTVLVENKAKLNQAMVTVLKDQAVVRRFADLTAEAWPSTSAEATAMFDAEERAVVPLIKKLGIKAE